MRFKMCPQTLLLQHAASHWLHLFCLFSTLRFQRCLLNYMDWCIHNQTGCICFVFDSMFSNVIADGLSERIHSCTGCICFIVTKCAFSSVSSNCLPEQIYYEVCDTIGLHHTKEMKMGPSDTPDSSQNS